VKPVGELPAVAELGVGAASRAGAELAVVRGSTAVRAPTRAAVVYRRRGCSLKLSPSYLGPPRTARRRSGGRISPPAGPLGGHRIRSRASSVQNGGPDAADPSTALEAQPFPVSLLLATGACQRRADHAGASGAECTSGCGSRQATSPVSGSTKVTWPSTSVLTYTGWSCESTSSALASHHCRRCRW